MKIANRIFMLCLVVATTLFALPKSMYAASDQPLPDNLIKEAIQTSLNHNPQLFINEKSGNLDPSTRVTITNVEILRKGERNNRYGYWPVEARVAGVLETTSNSPEASVRRCVFNGILSFQVRKQKGGRLTATLDSRNQVKLDCKGKVTQTGEVNLPKQSSEAQDILAKAMSAKPEINGQPQANTLEQIIKDYSTNKGNFNIRPIGWEASKEKEGLWRIVLHYWDYRNDHQVIEWEYAPESGRLYPVFMQMTPSK